MEEFFKNKFIIVLFQIGIINSVVSTSTTALTEQSSKQNSIDQQLSSVIPTWCTHDNDGGGGVKKLCGI